MALKYILSLRSTSPPHLFLDQIKEMIKNDDELLPQTKKALLVMKRFKKSFIQLPLQMEVVLCNDFNCNLERALSPKLMSFTKTLWSEDNIKQFKEDKNKFLAKIIQLYEKMGYDVEASSFDDKLIPEIIKSIDEEEKKLLSKIANGK